MSKVEAKEKKIREKTLRAGGKTIRRSPQKLVRMVQETPQALGEARTLGQEKLSKNSSEKEERGRSPKRKPPKDFHYHHGEDSYNNRGRTRSRSRPRCEDHKED